MQRVVVHING